MTNPKQEKTVFIIKPDGVKRGLIGEIVSRIEKRGLKIIALDMIWASKEEMDNHYPKTRLGQNGWEKNRWLIIRSMALTLKKNWERITRLKSTR